MFPQAQNFRCMAQCAKHICNVDIIITVVPVLEGITFPEMRTSPEGNNSSDSAEKNVPESMW